MKFLSISTIVFILFSGSGCANLQTINRTSLLDKNKAVHLDAQQRVVTVNNNGKICAEPSPDALSAYAAATGLGLSAPTYGSASFANALQSSAGNIGLRTQSITLMRDALYRLCEASANDDLSDIDVAVYLNRSQDLTAAVLAVEQLTGAVIGPQVQISGTSNSLSMSAIALDSSLLRDAILAEAESQKQVNAAELGLESSIASKKAATQSREMAADELKALENSSPRVEADIQKAKDKLIVEDGLLASSESKIRDGEIELKAAKDVQVASKKALDVVEKKFGSTASSSAQATGSVGGTSASQRAISDAALIAVSSTVKEIVNTVLNKSYLAESCIAYLSRTPPAVNTDKNMTALDKKVIDAEKKSYEAIVDGCVAVLKGLN